MFCLCTRVTLLFPIQWECTPPCPHYTARLELRDARSDKTCLACVSGCLHWPKLHDMRARTNTVQRFMLLSQIPPIDDASVRAIAHVSSFDSAVQTYQTGQIYGRSAT